MHDVASLPRRRVATLAAGGLLAAGAIVAGRRIATGRGRTVYEVRGERTLMETSVAITALAADRERAHQAIEAAFGTMANVAAILNRFDPESSVGRLNRTGALDAPPAHLTTVLRHARGLSLASDGDFDVTVQPVLDYYLSLRSLGRSVAMTPHLERAVAERARRVGYKDLLFDERHVRLLRAGAGITLDGIAKGYVVDQGIAALRGFGIEEALIDAGGDLHAIARPESKHFWNIGVVDPWHTNRVAAVVRINNAAVSTSGNYEVYFSADRRLFHIINPHTGYSPNRYASVTIVAPAAIESDGAGVAAFSMALPKLANVLRSRGDEWLVFSWDDKARWRSKNLPLVAGEARVA